MPTILDSRTTKVFPKAMLVGIFFTRRDFHLVLSLSTSLFTKSFTQTHNNETSDPVDLSFIYDGTVKGDVCFEKYWKLVW